MTTQRLPTVSSDLNTWGTVLNGYLQVAHGVDGGLTAWYDVKNPAYGAVGDGSTNDTAAIVAAIAACGASTNKGTVFFPPGVYMTAAFAVPPGVSLLGAGRGVSIIRKRDAVAGVFINYYGSHTSISRLTIDGQRATQTENLGSAAIQIVKPNGTSGGASNISGGILLTSGPSAGATSIAVSTATLAASGINVPVQPWDVISLVEGALKEQIRVSPSYTAGATTITLYTPLLNTFTTAAKVAVFSTDVEVSDCTVYACGRDGISLWHAHGCTIVGNFVYDWSDTGIDQPSGGSRLNKVIGNTIESNGRYAIAMDNPDAATFGETSDLVISGNSIRMLNGGSDGLGTATTAGHAIWIGSVLQVSVANNVIDMTRAGITGIRLDIGSQYCSMVGNQITGSNIATSKGIDRNTGGTWDSRMTVTGNVIRNVVTGIDMQKSLLVSVMGNVIENVTSYGINVEMNTVTAQDVSIMGNMVDTCTAGVRLGVPGATTAGKGRVWGNVITNASFAPLAVDAGWTVTMQDSPTGLIAGGTTTLAGLSLSAGTKVSAAGQTNNTSAANVSNQGVGTVALPALAAVTSGTVTITDSQITTTSLIFLTVGRGTTTPTALGSVVVAARLPGSGSCVVDVRNTHATVATLSTDYTLWYWVVN